MKAVRLAMDLGVTRFDVARSYGYGEAERILGECVRDRRSEVHITTKFGIEPPPRSRLLPLKLALGRALRAAGAPIRSAAKRVAGRSFSRPPINAVQMRKSLETSLRELGTEYVDLLLIHSATPADVANGDLIEALESVVEKGLARGWGVSADDATIREVVSRPCSAAAFQISSSIFRNAALTLETGGRTLLTNSAFRYGGSLEGLRQTFVSEPRLSGMLDELGFSRDDPDWPARLALCGALSSGPGVAVVVGMTTASHIRQNVSWALSNPLDRLAVTRVSAALGEIATV